MAKRRKSSKPTRKVSKPSRASKPSEEELQGPPPREATILRGDLERHYQRELEEHHETSPKLTGGDLDADWQRANSDGEEAVGGSVSTPDQNVVDELGSALGVPRAPDEEVRASSEILEERDRHRREREE